MAAVRIAEVSANGSGNSASITHGLTILENDVLVAQVITNGDVEVNSPPSGWTLAPDTGELVNNAYAYVYTKPATDSEPSSYAWGLDGSDTWAVIILQTRGVDTATPWAVAPSSTTRSAISLTDPKSAPSVDATDESLAIAFVFGDTGSNTVGTIGNSFSNQHNVTSNRRISLATRAFASAAATGTTEVSFTDVAFWFIQHAVLSAAEEGGEETPVPVFRHHYMIMKRH